MSMVDTTQSAVRDDADRLIALLTEQRELYRRLKGQADRQRTVITGNEPQKLLEILIERKQVLDRLNALDNALRPYRAQWSVMRYKIEPSRSQQVSALLDDVNTLLRDIIRQDEQDAELLAARRSATGQQISTIRTRRQAGAAYQAAATQSTSSQSEWTGE